MNVLLLGATGLVGGQLLDVLLETPEVSRVRSLGRRPLGGEHPQAAHPRLDHHVVDFDHLDAHAALFEVDAVMSCLGTTHAKAGSKAAFRRVDHDIPLAAAQLARQAGAAQHHLVSSLGANARSPLNYAKVKGQIEAAVEALGFPVCHVYRPSQLLGDRGEPRPMEAVGELFGQLTRPLMLGPLRALRPIHGRTVALAMRAALLNAAPGQHTHEPEAIRALAGLPDG